MISEQEYLRSSYEPDCELVNGRLIDRNVGERPHSVMIAGFLHYIHDRRKLWAVQAFPSLRIRIAPGRYRVPDVCIYKVPAPREKVFTTPPFIVIEILSSEDRMSRVRLRIDDFLKFGVPYIWLIDPENRKADVYTPQLIYEAKDLVLRTEDPHIEVPLAELFTEVDE